MRDVNYLDGRYVPGTTQVADSSTFPDYDGLNMYGEQESFLNMTDTFLGSVVPGLVNAGQIGSGQAAAITRIFGLMAPNYFGEQLLSTQGYAEFPLNL